MLLHVVKGPTSFSDLRTIKVHVCETFREACQRKGLLENNGHCDMTLSEAAATQTPKRRRHLFAIILTTCSTSNPLEIWTKYKTDLSEDILMQIRRENPQQLINFTEEMLKETLMLFEYQCIAMSGKALQLLGLPAPIRNPEGIQMCREIFIETNYNIDELTAFVSENEPILVLDQRDAYNYILSFSETNKGGIVFLDAPGGTGKTFLINLLQTKFRQQNKIALAVASSGIADTLLKGGRTAHSTFKLPLNLSHSDSPVCNIAQGSVLAKLLQKCSAIIWDECTMSHQRALEAVDRLLQDLRSKKYIIRGVVVVLAGDFHQTLPVIPISTPADDLNAFLKASYLWRKVQKMSLNTTMRVYMTGDVSAGLFLSQLLTIGDGKAPVNSTTGQITFPINFCCIVTSIEKLKAKMFPNIQLHFKNSDWLCKRAILVPKNDSVNKINLQIPNLLPGVCTTYKSIDPAQALFYPTEFLNFLEPQGLPPHNLFLKPGAPILLLRNLDPPKLCNRTRLLIKNLFPHVIEATILTGCATGEDVFIPTIPLIPSDLPFDLKRLQFPVQLAFAMSINKAQGQSLKVVGIDLQFPCFSHGQLYGACSRVGTAQNLFVFASEGKTKNVVYQKALE
ncbi:ATP-dependent DNA helicase Pif1-like [Anomaloglossus baeobatrachus]|uniref:ATP-dependent DNA helicase Pif1-like n=1 Tax=Anomaloglossus baeobatrachus TaxID=238106 RepID=UPI003F500376